jgi:hypothetical protein
MHQDPLVHHETPCQRCGRLQVCWQDAERIESPGQGGDYAEVPLAAGMVVAVLLMVGSCASGISKRTPSTG